MADKMYVGDVGTLFRVDCETDITGATVHQIHVRKPDGTEVQWDATVVNNNFLEYTIVTGDFDQKGKHSAHAYVELPSGKWTGELFKFTLYDKWK